jgi:hypothetical protein
MERFILPPVWVEVMQVLEAIIIGKKDNEYNLIYSELCYYFDRIN